MSMCAGDGRGEEWTLPNVLAGKDTLLKMMQNRAEVNKGTISTCMISLVQTL